MPGTFIRDNAATQLLDGSSYTADITIGTTDFSIPHPGRCTAVLTIGAVTGTDPTALVNIAAGDGTNWARVGSFFIDEDDANSTKSVYIDDGGNGPYMTVELDVGGTSPDFTLTLELEVDRYDEAPLMSVGDGAAHTTPTPALPDLTD